MNTEKIVPAYIGHIWRFVLVFSLLFILCTISKIAHGKNHKSIKDTVYNNSGTITNFSNVQFDSWAYFSNAHFRSWANFSDAQFNAPAIFTSVQFDSVADFSYANFNSWAYFYDANFNSWANLSHVKFDSIAYFSHTHFFLTADFFRAQFNSWADFSDAHFDILADFSNTRFVSLAYFYNAHFNIFADFSGSYFDTLANFRYAHFDSVADFRYAHFSSLADFQYAHFKKKIILRNVYVNQNVRFDFNNSVLPDTIDLSNNPVLSLELRSTMDFTLADSLNDTKNIQQVNYWQELNRLIKFYFYPHAISFESNRIHWINLYNTDVSRIKIDYTHFKLYFKDIDRQDTLSRDLSDDTKASIYEQLLKDFKDRGQTDSYEKLDIEYRWFKGNNNPLLTGFIDWWWRFGYEKWRIFLHSFIIILFFSLINFFLMHKLNDRNNGVYQIDLVPEFLPFKYSENSVYRILRRLWFSLVYTSIIFFLLTFKIEKINFAKPISIWIMFIYTIGLICVGFIANLILQK